MKNDLINRDFECVYLYIIEILIIKYSVIFLVMIIGLFLRIPLEVIGVICAFKILREYVGGVHANNKRTCLIISVLLIITFSLVASYIYIPIYISIIIMLICDLIVILIGPIECSSRKNISKKQCKIKIWKSTSALLIAYVVLRKCNFSSLSNGIILGTILCTIITIIGSIIIKKVEKKI